ncbi:MAG: hypothetical protein K6C94_05310, partial [Candidatus Gastranaerophilales bacterium]|nr:hypothetical protein [Candidatus Gastranaerophilales bacterium]
NGNTNEFFDNMYHGDEFEISCKEKQYFIQSYYNDFKIYTHEIIVKQTNPKIDNDTIFECKSNNPQQNIEDFQNAKIFEGKSFWEVEQEITWID